MGRHRSVGRQENPSLRVKNAVVPNRIRSPSISGATAPRYHRSRSIISLAGAQSAGGRRVARLQPTPWRQDCVLVKTGSATGIQSFLISSGLLEKSLSITCLLLSGTYILPFLFRFFFFFQICACIARYFLLNTPNMSTMLGEYFVTKFWFLLLANDFVLQDCVGENRIVFLSYAVKLFGIVVAS